MAWFDLALKKMFIHIHFVIGVEIPKLFCQPDSFDENIYWSYPLRFLY